MIDRPERDTLLALIDRFTEACILVLADFVADEFVDGEISRVSREAPVLILQHRQTRIVPGGGANAANNLVDLGARVIPFSVVGHDSSGVQLIDLFRKKRVPTAGILMDRDFSTTTKTRILAGSAHTVHQQVVRIDRQAPGPPSPEILNRLYAKVKDSVQDVDAILVSDYGSGLITPERVEALFPRTARRRIPMTVDSRYQIENYRGCTAATPNEPEVEAALGRKIGNDLKTLESGGRKLLKVMQTQALLMTRGKDGLALFQAGRKTVHLPIFGSDQVTDVTGAGDTVIAVFTLALACGANFLEASRLANYAGGLVVMKRGTATLRPEELTTAVKSDCTA